MNINRVKLARMIMKFAEIQTDKGILIYDGELVVGTEVYIEKDGEVIPAEDGDYVYEDKTIKVQSGVVSEIIEKETELETDEEIQAMKDQIDQLTKENEDLKVQITDKDSQIAEKDTEIENLKKEIEDLKGKIEMSTQKPAHVEIKTGDVVNKSGSKALKYFQE